jgi:hypothetical protein
MADLYLLGLAITLAWMAYHFVATWSRYGERPELAPIHVLVPALWPVALVTGVVVWAWWRKAGGRA